jgi:chromosome segregation ATPase
MLGLVSGWLMTPVGANFAAISLGLLFLWSSIGTGCGIVSGKKIDALKAETATLKAELLQRDTIISTCEANMTRLKSAVLEQSQAVDAMKAQSEASEAKVKALAEAFAAKNRQREEQTARDLTKIRSAAKNLPRLAKCEDRLTAVERFIRENTVE